MAELWTVLLRRPHAQTEASGRGVKLSQPKCSGAVATARSVVSTYSGGTDIGKAYTCAPTTIAAQRGEEMTGPAEMTPCTLWPMSTSGGGSGDEGGYGRLTVNGRTYYAHRWVWEQLNGTIPLGMVVHHRCRNCACVNPDHLELEIAHGDHARRHYREDGPQGWAKIHAQASTCKNGHPFDGHSGKQRTCSICKKAIQARYGERHPEVIHSDETRRKARERMQRLRDRRRGIQA